MIALPKYNMTIDECLVCSERQPKETGRFEVWDTEIVEMHDINRPADAVAARTARLAGQSLVRADALASLPTPA